MDNATENFKTAIVSALIGAVVASAASVFSPIVYFTNAKGTECWEIAKGQNYLVDQHSRGKANFGDEVSNIKERFFAYSEPEMVDPAVKKLTEIMVQSPVQGDALEKAIIELQQACRDSYLTPQAILRNLF